MNICILTGASSGLGEEFLKESVNSLSNIDEYWIIARNLEKLKLSASKYSANIRCIPLDLTKLESVNELKGLLDEAKPTIKALINNAGFGKLGNVWEVSYTDQFDMVNLNCASLSALCAMSINYMDEGSFILNVSSIASFAPNPRMTCYSSTKAYVTSYTRSLRFELRNKKINACVCCPGPMATAFLSAAGIEKGSSHTFDTLPYCDPKMVAKNSLKAAKNGKGVYTPRLFFKFYRLLAKLLPTSLVMHISKT